MNSIKDILVNIQKIISLDSLNTEIEGKILSDILSANGICNKEIFELYDYCNGSNYYVDVEYKGIKFSSFGYILKVEDALQIYNEEFLEFKQKKLFPIIADFAGDYLLISTDKENCGVYIYSPALFIIEPEIIFESFISFLSMIFTCYQLNVYTISDNQLIEDIDAESTIFNMQDKTYSNWVIGNK
ncbi:hypothetical protein CAP35_07910 [Chitinophagaceae bacterium IBVUCB1]|nr:hypothetical protein CAP35_07910 [Chitinophagaceae bacterium IBVUCB1]